jgi:transcriptional regulator of arginine metabolism
MKSQRHQLILQLVQDEFIATQQQLQKQLKNHGMLVTQATLSRDIKELSLIKTVTGSGEYRYTVPKLKRESLLKEGQAFNIISEAVVTVDYALNTVVVKCHEGMAQAVCAKLDRMGVENVVGTLAGDDTIFILMRTENDAGKLVRELKSIIA